jgi:hypothetical protein
MPRIWEKRVGGRRSPQTSEECRGRTLKAESVGADPTPAAACPPSEEGELASRGAREGEQRRSATGEGRG